MFSCSPTWCALILRELNQMFIACLFKGSQEQSFFLQTLLFTAFLVTVLRKFNIRTCEYMIIGQLRMGARQTKNAPLSIKGANIFYKRFPTYSRKGIKHFVKRWKTYSIKRWNTFIFKRLKTYFIKKVSKIFYQRWEANQFDRLAAGSLAGHLIECGAQVAQSPLDDNHYFF